jgi:hypothetical protein
VSVCMHVSRFIIYTYTTHNTHARTQDYVGVDEVLVRVLFALVGGQEEGNDGQWLAGPAVKLRLCMHIEIRVHNQNNLPYTVHTTENHARCDINCTTSTLRLHTAALPATAPRMSWVLRSASHE